VLRVLTLANCPNAAWITCCGSFTRIFVKEAVNEMHGLCVDTIAYSLGRFGSEHADHAAAV
jgi:hypothetical protein